MVEEDREWDTALPLTMMAYTCTCRSSIQKTTGETPFYLTFRREILPIDVVFGSPPNLPIQLTSNYAANLVSRLQHMYHHVHESMDIEQRKKNL